MSLKYEPASVLVEDEWFKTRALPDLNSWGEEVEPTIPLAPDRAEEVAAYLDEEAHRLLYHSA